MERGIKVRKGYIGFLVKISNLINLIIINDPFVKEVIDKNDSYNQFC
jgi:hypothetical protein